MEPILFITRYLGLESNNIHCIVLKMGPQELEIIHVLEEFFKVQ